MTEHKEKTRVAVAVFAHNEEDTIALCLADLRAQVFDAGLAVHTTVLCNGCTDSTFQEATRAVADWPARAGVAEAQNLVEGGKSRTWNAFVAQASAAGAELVVFVDGDIRIADPHAIGKLLAHLDDPSVSAAVSRPVPTFDAHMPAWLRAVFDRTKTGHEDGAICGMFYAARMEAIRDVRLPVPCLVEDGFLAACLCTRMFSAPGAARAVRAAPDVAHEYVVPKSFEELYRHSVRLELGTEMNAALFTPLWAARTQAERVALLEDFAAGRKLEEAYAAYLVRPDIRAPTRRLLKRFARESGREATASIARAPLRIAKNAYQLGVGLHARRLFEARTFRW